MLHPETTNAGESEDVSHFFAVLYAVFLYFCVYLITKVDTRAGNTGRKEGDTTQQRPSAQSKSDVWFVS